MSLRRILAPLLVALLLLGFGLPVGVLIALNTVQGRAFAVAQINRLAGGTVNISGLGGHFPADIILSALRIKDAKGVWLSATGLELRWKPWALLYREGDVTAFTATALDVARAPEASGQAPKSTSPLPPWLPGIDRLDIDRLAIPSLRLGSALAGRDIVLNATGSVHLRQPLAGGVVLNATSPAGASYHLDGSLDAKTVLLRLHAAEPPDGPLGAYAGPLVPAPLTLDLLLSGPRDAAGLTFVMALGAARMEGAGTLGLNPEKPMADMVLSIPALAPFGAMAGTPIAGNTRLHLRITAGKKGAATLKLDGALALTAAPHGLAMLVGPAGHLVLQAGLRSNSIDLQQLDVTGAQMNLHAGGRIAKNALDLTLHAELDQVGTLSPGLSGGVQADASIQGAPRDFAVEASLTGAIAARKTPSSRFSLRIAAQHLPQTPSGTLTGSGTLENAPLRLQAVFARSADGTMTLNIPQALWRSFKLTAELRRAANAALPTGTAHFSAQMADFAAFSPIHLQGGVTGDFAYSSGASLQLDLTARSLLADPQLGPVNGTLHASGPIQALALRLQASLARFLSAPAQAAAAGVLNLEARSARISALSASWRQLDLRLLGPAEIALQPGLAVRHLAFGLNGGRLGLEGTLSPHLHATLTAQDLPLSLASLFAPTVNASGTLSAMAALAGSASAPKGRITLSVSALKLHTGPAASLPAADFSGTATVSGASADIQTALSAGPNVALTAAGQVPLHPTGPLNLHVAGRTDLRLLDPILAAEGSILRGVMVADLTLTGRLPQPRADGSVTLADGSVDNITSGLSLTGIAARVQAAGRLVTLQNFQATAGKGSITGHGTIDFSRPGTPLDVTVDAENATPIASDLVTETLDAALSLTGALQSEMQLGGSVTVTSAQINIPKSLPPDVANLPIRIAGEPPPPPPSPPPPLALDLALRAQNRIFVRGDGLFAELGGHLRITGTAANPEPEGGFDLLRGDFSLAGKTLEFTRGTVSFNGAGWMPTLDLEATSTSTGNGTTATLIVGGTVAKPTITLTSTPPLPGDEVLAQLLFGESTAELTPFQAAELAAALAQLSGLGGGASPFESVRNALGLSELSISGSGSGAPSLQAGRYVAPGVYVSATQATNGQGPQASVQINLYKGLKLQTRTGTSGSGSGSGAENSSSVGLSYQFNY